MYTNDDLQNLSPEEKKRKKRTLQTEMIMLESDHHKFVEQKNVLDAEIRNLEMNEKRLRVDMDDRRAKMERVTRKITENEAEVKKLKGKMNLL